MDHIRIPGVGLELALNRGSCRGISLQSASRDKGSNVLYETG